MSANLELFSFVASTADGLQVGAALLTEDFGLFQACPLVVCRT
jgi:hypothetical protein